jgi:antitoxin component HigA of HigAB toxin-antitoxin module
MGSRLASHDHAVQVLQTELGAAWVPRIWRACWVCTRAWGSKILKGDRSLTVEHVRKLAAHFKVSAELFID